MRFSVELVVVFFSLYFHGKGECKYCPKILSIDLSNGSTRSGSTIVKYGISFDPSHYYVEDGLTFGCVCDIIRTCIRVCCDKDINVPCVISTPPFHSLKDWGQPPLKYFFLRDGSCEPGYFKVLLEGPFYLQTNGSIYGSDLTPADAYIMYSPREYCLQNDDDGDVNAFVCLDGSNDEDGDTSSKVHKAGMIISMPFLLLTFLVYAILPETSLHRKALMSYVLTLFAGYVFLVVTQLSNSIPNELCHVMGYSIIFFFTVSFFWMNVMCIDMWLAFSGMKVYNGMRGTEKKRFLFYCLYAWGVPLLHVFIVFMINTFGDKTSVYYPHLGTKRCYVEDGLPELFYFYLPMAIVIVINIVLFILTTVRIQQVKRETAMLKHTDSKRHSYEDDKQKFNLYLKLMLAMGINWSMEVISWAVTWKLTKAPTWIWYLTDFTNATYGAVIFFIFVFKKKIWISLKKRYYVWMGKPHLAHAMSRTTHGTRTSNFSTTDTTTVNNDYRMSNMKNGREEERALN